MKNDKAGQGAQPEELKPEDWAGDMGLKWLASLSLFEEMIAPIGDALLGRADYRDGETVIDLGCGGGATTLAIAQSVAPTGQVMGVDISPDLVAAARLHLVETSPRLRAIQAETLSTAPIEMHWHDRLDDVPAGFAKIL